MESSKTRSKILIHVFLINLLFYDGFGNQAFATKYFVSFVDSKMKLLVALTTVKQVALLSILFCNHLKNIGDNIANTDIEIVLFGEVRLDGGNSLHILHYSQDSYYRL